MLVKSRTIQQLQSSKTTFKDIFKYDKYHILNKVTNVIL